MKVSREWERLWAFGPVVSAMICFIHEEVGVVLGKLRKGEELGLARVRRVIGSVCD